MELNSKVQVKLTEAGANVLNDTNKCLQEKYNLLSFKTDYKAGDMYYCLLWQLFECFGSCNNAGSEHAFVHLLPATNGKQLRLSVNDPGGCPFESLSTCVLRAGGTCSDCRQND